MMEQFYAPLAGGMLLGLSAALLLILNGRIAGVSGILGGVLSGKAISVNLAFTLGLLTGPSIWIATVAPLPKIETTAPMALIAIAGLLVGFGSRMGAGCTSGHGILGIARLSKRSLVAVVTFLSTGILTVAVLRGLL